MINSKKYEFIRNKYGLYASWAVWVKKGDKPKSNMADLSIFDDEEILSELKPNIVLVGLNCSGVDGALVKPFQNFHGPGGGAYKIRYALDGTSFWGAYMTDILKGFSETNSNKVLKCLKNDPALEAKNIYSFEQELKDVGSADPLLVCFGNDAFDISKRNLSTKFSIVKVTHYSHFESKEIFREKMQKIIEDHKTYKDSP
jgi:hypothetical protein